VQIINKVNEEELIMIKAGDTVKIMQVGKKSSWYDERDKLIGRFGTVDFILDACDGLGNMWKSATIRSLDLDIPSNDFFCNAIVLKKVEVEEVLCCTACGAEDSIVHTLDRGYCTECHTPENYSYKLVEV